MKNYNIDFAKNTITVSEAFMKKAGQLGTTEFTQMMELRKLGMRIEVQKAKRHKKPTFQLTYKKMEVFVRCSDDAEALMAEFEHVKEEAKSQHNPCLYVQNWFKQQFPNYPKRDTKVANDATLSNYAENRAA